MLLEDINESFTESSIKELIYVPNWLYLHLMKIGGVSKLDDEAFIKGHLSRSDLEDYRNVVGIRELSGLFGTIHAPQSNTLFVNSYPEHYCRIEYPIEKWRNVLSDSHKDSNPDFGFKLVDISEKSIGIVPLLGFGDLVRNSLLEVLLAEQISLRYGYNVMRRINNGMLLLNLIKSLNRILHLQN